MMSDRRKRLSTLEELQTQVGICSGTHDYIISETGKIEKMNFQEFGGEDVIKSLELEREGHRDICEYLYDRLKQCLAMTGEQGEFINDVEKYTPIVDTMTCMAYMEEARIKEFTSKLEKMWMAKILDNLIDRVKALESRGA